MDTGENTIAGGVVSSFLALGRIGLWLALVCSPGLGCTSTGRRTCAGDSWCHRISGPSLQTRNSIHSVGP